MIVKFILIILLLVPLADATEAEAAAAARQVTPSVHLSAAGADSLELVWRFQLEDGWYLYAPYRNDTGFAPSVALDLPEGWSAGPLVFPVPERKVLPGDILDHVFEGELLVTQTLRTGGSPAADGDLEARLFWLACRDLCVPGQATLQVPVGGRPDPQAVGLLTRARGRQPSALPDGTVRIEHAPQMVRLTVPGASRLTFIPAESGPRLENLLHDGTVQGQTLSLRIRPPQADEQPLRGLLSIDYNDGQRLTGTLTLD